jgi:hypothetical protein
MARIIIGIHGLKNKPPRKYLRSVWKKSIQEGFRNQGYRHPFFRFEMAYWAGHLHSAPLDPGINDPDHPLYLNEPYCEGVHVKRNKPGRLEKKARDLLEKQLDRIFLNDDLSINYSDITDRIIQRYFQDLDAYYSTACVDGGPKCLARDRIQDELVRVLLKNRRKRICLITHSMGSIIAFDVLIRLEGQVEIDTMITAGSPLGIPAVISKIAALAPEGRYRDRICTPENITRRWYNLSDMTDKVAINYNLRDDYHANSRKVRVRDKQVINDFYWEGRANPHKSYGYLRTPEMARILHTFLRHGKRVFWRIPFLPGGSIR